MAQVKDADFVHLMPQGPKPCLLLYIWNKSSVCLFLIIAREIVTVLVFVEKVEEKIFFKLKVLSAQTFY